MMNPQVLVRESEKAKSAMLRRLSVLAAGVQTMRATGIAVSVSGGGRSGGSGVTSQYSPSWTNNKASISDLSGKSQAKGLLLKFSVNSLAFATHNGVIKSVDVCSPR